MRQGVKVNASRNIVLAGLMAQHGLSAAQLAQEVNQKAFELYQGHVGTTERHVRRWLSGQVRWPQRRYREALTVLFERPASELGFTAPATRRSSSAADSGVTVPVLPVAPAQREQPVLRREFLVTSSAALAIPPLPTTGRLGMPDIERIRSTAAQLHALDDQLGGAVVVEAGRDLFEHVEGAMRRCVYGSTVQPHLHRVLGEIAASVGWFAYDAGHHATARRWWDTGLRHALLARHPLLQARIWAYMSRQACDLGHGAEAAAIARVAIDVTRRHRDGKLSALLHTRIALANAVQGHSGWSNRALHHAEQAFDRAADTPPPWLAFCTPAELLAQAALCSSTLGDYARAAQLRQHEDAQPRQRFRRNAFGHTTHLAQCLLHSGQAEQAFATADQAREMLPHVHSPRWANRLAAFRDEAVERRLPGADDFAEQYDLTVAAIERART
ncbi:hypothetical protein [Allostreptomyces psammosilenae]|uniref:Uncharacterized protein n=1 Tax=Allostreptomyces psammosilenae TaxID=1892865 RepID=A0A853A0K2_9ACTN|nr:hypothetical protein [Allostreptomyces psammosilenae]NYI07657.1 hypothetical protein [Allostreptomyces psammosilenae]